jgi:hypothetical protein
MAQKQLGNSFEMNKTRQFLFMIFAIWFHAVNHTSYIKNLTSHFTFDKMIE